MNHVRSLSETNKYKLRRVFTVFFFRGVGKRTSGNGTSPAGAFVAQEQTFLLLKIRNF